MRRLSRTAAAAALSVAAILICLCSGGAAAPVNLPAVLSDDECAGMKLCESLSSDFVHVLSPSHVAPALEAEQASNAFDSMLPRGLERSWTGNVDGAGVAPRLQVPPSSLSHNLRNRPNTVEWRRKYPAYFYLMQDVDLQHVRLDFAKHLEREVLSFSRTYHSELDKIRVRLFENEFDGSATAAYLELARMEEDELFKKLTAYRHELVKALNKNFPAALGPLARAVLAADGGKQPESARRPPRSASAAIVRSPSAIITGEKRLEYGQKPEYGGTVTVTTPPPRDAPAALARSPPRTQRVPVVRSIAKRLSQLSRSRSDTALLDGRKPNLRLRRRCLSHDISNTDEWRRKHPAYFYLMQDVDLRHVRPYLAKILEQRVLEFSQAYHSELDQIRSRLFQREFFESPATADDLENVRKEERALLQELTARRDFFVRFLNKNYPAALGPLARAGLAADSGKQPESARRPPRSASAAIVRSPSAITTGEKRLEYGQKLAYGATVTTPQTRRVPVVRSTAKRLSQSNSANSALMGGRKHSLRLRRRGLSWLQRTSVPRATISSRSRANQRCRGNRICAVASPHSGEVMQPGDASSKRRTASLAKPSTAKRTDNVGSLSVHPRAARRAHEVAELFSWRSSGLNQKLLPAPTFPKNRAPAPQSAPEVSSHHLEFSARDETESSSDSDLASSNAPRIGRLVGGRAAEYQLYQEMLVRQAAAQQQSARDPK